jgi:hypothetical protein
MLISSDKLKRKGLVLMILHGLSNDIATIINLKIICSKSFYGLFTDLSFQCNILSFNLTLQKEKGTLHFESQIFNILYKINEIPIIHAIFPVLQRK